jgi:hypothetical protein
VKKTIYKEENFGTCKKFMKVLKILRVSCTFYGLIVDDEFNDEILLG